MITGQLSKPLLSLRSEASAAELRGDDKAATPDSELNEPLLLLAEATDGDDAPSKLFEGPGRTCGGRSPGKRVREEGVSLSLHSAGATGHMGGPKQPARGGESHSQSTD
ncbi:hypothetical protein AAFF_G00001700 [Aldrovandia affinis]|uniref:Uncharacterized protein n=1 Tax=Aldrovandia affinis TaxID=143900 RepID=A0AAD7TEG3_9TELE|nr:hypothetical protein AAFF_G00001700 [Aldrovandia affinis]